MNDTSLRNVTGQRAALVRGGKSVFFEAIPQRSQAPTTDAAWYRLRRVTPPVEADAGFGRASVAIEDLVDVAGELTRRR